VAELTEKQGGVVGAINGTLAFMYGSSQEYAPKIIPVLSLMGVKERLFHTGAPGSGLGAKLANNYLAGTITLALSEALTMGVKMGLDPKVLSDIFAVSTSGNWINANANPVPGVQPTAAASNGYKGGFRLALCKKDIGLAVNAAKHVNSQMVIGPTVLECYEDACKNPEYADKDCTIMYQWLQKR
jgi:3-hydroxyisobutyrate dehydrogenase